MATRKFDIDPVHQVNYLVTFVDTGCDGKGRDRVTHVARTAKGPDAALEIVLDRYGRDGYYEDFSVDRLRVVDESCQAV